MGPWAPSPSALAAAPSPLPGAGGGAEPRAGTFRRNCLLLGEVLPGHLEQEGRGDRGRKRRNGEVASRPARAE